MSRRDQEEEESRDKERRDRNPVDDRRGSRRDRGLPPDPFDSLDSDWAGRDLLKHYLYGKGAKFEERNDPAWTAYMTANEKLRLQVWSQVLEVATELVRKNTKDVRRNKAGRQPTFRQFHAEVENGEGIIGYHYLHGTNKDVGDFQIVGFGEVSRYQGPRVVFSSNPYKPPRTLPRRPGVRVDLELTYVWNDIIDPNYSYSSDTIKSVLGFVISGGNAEDYVLSIGWRDTCTVWLPDMGGQLISGGYPEL